MGVFINTNVPGMPAVPNAGRSTATRGNGAAAPSPGASAQQGVQATPDAAATFAVLDHVGNGTAIEGRQEALGAVEIIRQTILDGAESAVHTLANTEPADVLGLLT